jgi:hypothetical protein
MNGRLTLKLYRVCYIRVLCLVFDFTSKNQNQFGNPVVLQFYHRTAFIRPMIGLKREKNKKNI